MAENNQEETGEEGKMPLTEHLSELRKRLIVSIAAIGIGFIASFNFSDRLIGLIVKSINIKIVFLAPTEAFWAEMKVAFFCGLLISLPVLLHQVWKFVAPALHPHERQYGLPFVILSFVFFLIGVAFALAVVLPFAIGFLLSYQTEWMQPMISVGNLVDFYVKFLLAFGLVFEMPLAITILSKIGVLTPAFLSRNRKYAILANSIIAAVLTPTTDVFNMMLMAIPLIILYEIGIISARIFGKKKGEDHE
ncbi:MAG: twin-arginine translocase subunit TatC [Nitrospirae bacterium]|nr:twin-arginine translocase subunit TatC [Nitrospirota bacterium]